ncbi:MAG TPA: PIN domain-containing protein [Vitreimonas sp.]|uniref:PIN domain-containing protein n=1 Tax=Vitreimonas sp. TaxID=3069702 RepID=UPI002D311ADA|nr:PIN domain-containing protein [Vitreimonas sp.]HYD87590.1 PIN domain-containing protein [Vitreimonas sp.]
MKGVSSTLVVDAAVLVSALLGRQTGAMLEAVRACRLVTTDRAVLEVSRRVELGLKRPELLSLLDAILVEMAVVPVAALSEALPRAEIVLRDSVPSRTGSTTDAHVLALSWAVDGDIWTHDRDFAGAGVATWSTANLMRALRAA